MKTLINDSFENDPSVFLEWAFGENAARHYFNNRMMDQRAGQAFMNTLAAFDIESYLRLSGSLVDPFYRDDQIPAAIDKLTS